MAQERSVADYIACYKKLATKTAEHFSGPAIRVALLSSFTTTGLKETLGVKCFEQGITAEIFEAPYSQIAQTILQPHSPLYQPPADLAVLFVDTMDLLGENFFFPYRLSEEQRRKCAEEKINELIAWTERLTAGGIKKVLLHNFRVPAYSSLGILENKQNFGFFSMVRFINERIEDKFKKNNNVFVFDYDGFCSRQGKIQITNNKMYYLGDFKLAFASMSPLCDDYLAYLKPLASRSRKCLILDLDNTVWGGVLGEDGMGGIRVGPTPEGRPFLEFQKSLLNLMDRGILLAINSNNNPEEVEQVFKEHPYMVFRKKDFAALEINWNDKVSNLRSIAKQLNIGLEALVFLDDLPSNRAIVRAALPEVLVPEMPEDPSEYVAFLNTLTDFNTFQLTEVDKNRNQLYAAERQRQEIRAAATDLNTYLKGLNIAVTIAAATQVTIPRIAQLTQKTNQFNMTTRRYLEPDIQHFISDSRFWVLSLQVADRFGDSGMTGVLVIEKMENAWRIDTFLLSCRVLGRKIEDAALAFLLKKAKQAGVSTLLGEFKSTQKNLPARDFYRKSGFELKEQTKGEEVWQRAVSLPFEAPSFIEVLWKD